MPSESPVPRWDARQNLLTDVHPVLDRLLGDVAFPLPSPLVAQWLDRIRADAAGPAGGPAAEAMFVLAAACGVTGRLDRGDVMTVLAAWRLFTAQAVLHGRLLDAPLSDRPTGRHGLSGVDNLDHAAAVFAGDAAGYLAMQVLLVADWARETACSGVAAMAVTFLRANAAAYRSAGKAAPRPEHSPALALEFGLLLAGCPAEAERTREFGALLDAIRHHLHRAPSGAGEPGTDAALLRLRAAAAAASGRWPTDWTGPAWGALAAVPERMTAGR